MWNKAFFSAATMMIGLTSGTVACEAMSLDAHPIVKYEDCSKKVAQTYKARVGNLKTPKPKEKEAFLKHFIEMAKHEQKRCKETCVDAPQAALGR
ncbi:hypothetical protein [Candidatus Odyssella acanthamoebae]|uniref:Lipoprotein n=1 Tax=Candidatus Odyssella acanthamoebae TaxID=91604 RepID=A0A077ASC6_9PROT|nr:hypothetical protein [Candidatus Paracaedibacter acanthamoebae]AIK96092.1 hypothetical protein ID47_04055 [Candidatus Paracaedibacter acanthamoebae]